MMVGPDGGASQPRRTCALTSPALLGRALGAILTLSSWNLFRRFVIGFSDECVDSGVVESALSPFCRVSAY